MAVVIFTWKGCLSFGWTSRSNSTSEYSLTVRPDSRISKIIASASLAAVLQIITRCGQTTCLYERLKKHFVDENGNPNEDNNGNNNTDKTYNWADQGELL